MNTSDRTPILVGVGQVEQRIDDVEAALEPTEMMIDAVNRAAEDAGSRALLTGADSVRVIRGMWAYENPARQVAERIGAPGAQTGITSLGGNYVQSVTNRSFLDIQSGRHDIIVVTGAECGRTRARAAKANVELAWSPTAEPLGPAEPADKADLFIGSTKVTRHPAETVRGIDRPVQYYPIFETALRHANGESPDEHLKRISELWADFNAVAVENPNAWIRNPLTAEQIRTPSPSNRAISYPYPKLMNSNVSVDQGAALIITSVGKARALGIPENRWVYPHAGAEAWDHLYVSERENLHSSPAIRFAGRTVLDLAGVGVDDLSYIDLYSCFPAAVQVAAREIGIPFDRRLTVTGGLTFAGGPLNNYVMHAVARTADLLRGDPGSKGLVTANGGLLTKHALCVYSTEPPRKPFQWADLQAEVDATPKRNVAIDHDGEVELESYVVMYGADAPSVAHVACRLDDGTRTWANTSEADLLQAMMKEEFCGRRGRVNGAGELTVS
ncbi:MAG: acetyl-CoA acetyltransferase [Gammaproteobacteria bacterium]|nr:acetyl-CoA acetyltransferase [Gammaproteobacteria bacterium]